MFGKVEIQLGPDLESEARPPSFFFQITLFQIPEISA